MLQYEEDLWARGIERIAGVDEAGRGCLFGDVVAAAVILPPGLRIEGIDDSKKLAPARREELYEIILERAVAVGIGRADSETIDRINIKQASRLAMKRAVDQLSASPQYLLIDAERIDSDIPQLPIIKGDALSQSIAAASIVAKVTRDRLCLEWDLQFPEYQIAIHKGYATKLHRDRIVEYGPSPMHRRSFLRSILAIQQELF